MPNSYTTLDLLAGSSGTNAVNQTVFGPFAFDYINSADVRFAVKVSSVWQIISVASFDTTTKLVTLSATPQTAHSAAHTDEARVYRSSTLSPIVDFQSGSRIAEADLDNAYKQGLFAAQEATEDAPGSASRTVQATDDLQEGAVTAPKLATDAVETLKIKNLQVTAAKLASTLDLSGKTVTLPANAVTTAAITDGNVSFVKLSGVLDDDTLDAASATTLATSESIKAYIDKLKPNIVQAVKTDILTELDPQNAWTDVTGLSVTITPKFSTSKFLISSSVSASAGTGSYAPLFRYVKGSTPIALALGATRGDRTPCAFTGGAYGNYHAVPAGLDYLDAQSVSAGVAITFKLQWTCETTVDIHINRSLSDTDTNAVPSPMSTLTVTEIYQ
jgi:hypothetical protein